MHHRSTIFMAFVCYAHNFDGRSNS